MPRTKVTTPNAVCQQCGLPFRGRKEAKYCSTKCRDKAREKRITFKCDFCGKEVQKQKSRADKWEAHFCSMECYTKWKNQNGLKESAKEKMREKKLKPDVDKDNYRRYHGKREHRVVAERMLGRPLKSSEVVHHINGNKQDNRPENLMIFSNQQEHAKYHKDHPEIQK